MESRFENITEFILTRAKGTKSLLGYLLAIMRLKTKFKGRNGIQTEIMETNRIQIDPTLNVKITLNVNCTC